jgi:hypothetical protein
LGYSEEAMTIDFESKTIDFESIGNHVSSQLE